jgi:hypothetical protein
MKTEEEIRAEIDSLQEQNKAMLKKAKQEDIEKCRRNAVMIAALRWVLNDTI